MKTRMLALAGAVIAIAPPLLPIVPDHWIALLVQIGIASLVALGLVILTGVGGMTSFAQAVFAGFGAYTTAVLTTAYGWSGWATLLPSLAVAGAGAVLIGLVTVRLSGHFLALATVAWALASQFFFGSLPILGQHTGINGIPPLHLGLLPLNTPQRFYGIVWVAVIVSTWLMLNVLDSRSGRSIRALRSGAQTGAAFGIEPMRAKLTIFVFAAVLAGLSGWLFAHYQRSVSPTVFGLSAGIEYLLMAVLGGAGHVYGALLGAVLVIGLREQLQSLLPQLLGQGGDYDTIVFGSVLVTLLIVARQGMWPWLRGRFPPLQPPPVPAATNAGKLRTADAIAGQPLLVAEGLTKRFGGLVAVNGVSFSVERGEIVGLIGPNGAGKSTTFNLITGALQPSAGSLQFDGKALGPMTAQRAAAIGIARTFQHVQLASGMTVLENVAIGAHMRGRRGALAAMLRADRSEEAMLLGIAAHQIERVGLGALMHQPVDSLALGQLRLVEVARALAMDPLLLVLDEPAAGLRFQEKSALAALLRQIREQGISVLLVEHDMDLVMSVVDRLVVLDFGTRIAQGDPESVRNSPAVIEAYLGASA